jgi:hypothetical protein
MNNGQQLLALISQDYTLVRKGRYFTTEEHDSFIIDPTKAVFYWNSKGINGDIFTYLTKIKGVPEYECFSVINSIPEDYTFTILEALPSTPNPALVNVFYEYGKEYTDYWTGYRGYTQQTIDEFKLGYTGKYWVIPIYVNGEFKNFQCRGFDPNGNKIIRSYYEGIGRLPFNFNRITDLYYSETIYIAEKPVDVIMLEQMGYPAISSNLGAMGWDHDWSKLLMPFEKVIIIYDNDEAGLVGAKRTAKYLMHNSEILVWPSLYKEKFDITDLYKRGLSLTDLEDYIVPSHIVCSPR